LFGKSGHRVRATISEMGPLLLSRLMNLSDAQEGVLNIAFKLADDEGLLLLDLKDLRALLTNINDRAKEIASTYGLVSTQSIGAIQRQLLMLEQQGGSEFFGEPALQISDLMRTTRDGRGAISVLAADKLMSSPRLYSTFLLWLLSELFEELPEVGDPDRPRLVFRSVRTWSLHRAGETGSLIAGQPPCDAAFPKAAQKGSTLGWISSWDVPFSK